MSAEASVLDRLAVGVVLLDPAGDEVYRTPRVGPLIEGTALADPDRCRRRLGALAQRSHAAGGVEAESFEGSGSLPGVRLSASPLPEGGTAVTFEPLLPSGEVQQRVRQFVSHLTHDLRTPLTSILGASDLLLSGRIGEVEERHARLLRIVGDGTQRLASLLTELSEKYIEPEVRS